MINKKNENLKKKEEKEEKKRKDYLYELELEKRNNDKIEKNLKELELIEQKYLEQYHKTRKLREEKEQKKSNMSMLELSNNINMKLDYYCQTINPSSRKNYTKASTRVSSSQKDKNSGLVKNIQNENKIVKSFNLNELNNKNNKKQSNHIRTSSALISEKTNNINNQNISKYFKKVNEKKTPFK